MILLNSVGFVVSYGTSSNKNGDMLAKVINAE